MEEREYSRHSETSRKKGGNQTDSVKVWLNRATPRTYQILGCMNNNNNNIRDNETLKYSKNMTYSDL